MNIDHDFLKTRQRAEREGHATNLALRVHRALSWLQRAEQCEGDLDARFIFLWIAFNAAYANEIGDRERPREQQLFEAFLQKLVDLDNGRMLYELIWSEFPRSIRVLLDNRFVFQPFWDFHNDRIEEQEWIKRFAEARTAANRALAAGDTTRVLIIVLARMYTLRNQIVHGGSTWNSRINRDQLRDCTAFLGKLVPTIILLMLDNPGTLWGDACYPVVEG